MQARPEFIGGILTEARLMIDEKSVRNAIRGSAAPPLGSITQEMRAGQGRIQQAIGEQIAKPEVAVLPGESDIEHGSRTPSVRFSAILPNGERVQEIFTYEEVVDSHMRLSDDATIKVRRLVNRCKVELKHAKHRK
jgi:hypothetical protein